MVNGLLGGKAYKESYTLDISQSTWLIGFLYTTKIRMTYTAWVKCKGQRLNYGYKKSMLVL